jgi:hypothetical protein
MSSIEIKVPTTAIAEVEKHDPAVLEANIPAAEGKTFAIS